MVLRWIAAVVLASWPCFIGWSGNADLVSRVASDPTLLRSESVYRDLVPALAEAYVPVLARIAADPAQAWDVRARAVIKLRLEESPAAWTAFARGFDPVVAASTDEGCAALNVLAAWMPKVGEERHLVEPLLLPGPGASRVTDVLAAAAGRAVADYLHFLYDRGYGFAPADLRGLAGTDDQDTRRFVAWYVGDRRLQGLEDLLVDMVAAERPSSYPDQTQRTVEAALTAGISELFRALAPTPPWLGPETTPKGLALEALEGFLPAGDAIEDRDEAARLLAAAAANASGHDRGQWQLAGDILRFLGARGEKLGATGSAALADLVARTLVRRGPLEPVVLAEEIHRRFGAALPQLAAAERTRLWKITAKTLNADYLLAVSRGWPDAKRQKELEAHLLAMADKAARGSLRVVRTWGADIETPGDWCRCVAAFGLTGAVPAVESVLDTSWTDEAVQSLVDYGSAGAPALARFLATPAGARLDEDLLEAGLRSVVEHLPASEAAPAVAALLAEGQVAPRARETLAGLGGRGEAALAAALAATGGP